MQSIRFLVGEARVVNFYKVFDQEINKIEGKIKTKGYAIFPIRLYENERGVLKLEIGLGQGKKTFDKRDDLKEKDIQREMQRTKF